MLAAGCGFIALYLRRHLLWERVPIVTKSLLFWQIIIINFLFALVSFAYPQKQRVGVALPTSLFAFVSLSFAPILDMCNASPAESKGSMAIIGFGLVLSLFANSFLCKTR